MKEKPETGVLELLLSPDSREPERADTKLTSAPPTVEGLVIGTLTGFDDAGSPLVSIPGSQFAGPVRALSIVVLDRGAIGRAVAIQFQGADLRKPVILGVIQGPLDAVGVAESPEPPAKHLDVELDGERLVLTADKEIVLKCGQSSITLTRAGKVLIRGAYLLSRSSGVNRIKGGSVQIN